MSLDFNFTKIAEPRDWMFYPDDKEEYGTYADQLRGEIRAVIFYMIPIGINYIKDEAVAATFYRRMVMYWSVKGWEPEPEITFELLTKLVGLSTNVSPKTDAAFRKDCVRWLDERAEQKTMQEVIRLRDSRAAAVS